MRRLLLALILAMLMPVSVRAQLPTPVYQRYWELQPNGWNSTYQQGFTHRYVNGEIRFLSITLGGLLQEIRLPASGVQTQTTGQWTLPGSALNNFNGIWWEASRNRLWITSTEDYQANYVPAKVTIVTLGSGTATIQKQFFLSVPAKRVYGGCQAVPAALVTQFGGPYVCGWGGYTSLIQQGGSASLGPTMYVIPDPDTITNGSSVSVGTILDAVNQRGVRLTIPQNYFDGGDPRPNPPTRPTAPVDPSGSWLSPNGDGLGWMVWGDSYYNTGFWIGNTFGLVASLCKGSCWYQSSTLEFDARQFELHLWNGAGLGSNILKRPDSMVELTPPRGNLRVFNGNVPLGNLSGATYDATTGRLYIVGYPLGSDDYTGRIYSYVLGAGAPATPTDAVVSAWSVWSGGAWSTCTAGTQTRTETRTRTVLTPATNGGNTPALSETRTATQGCTAPPPPTPTDAVVSGWSGWSGGEWSACVASLQTRTETRTRTVITAATNGGATPALSETRTASQACTVPTDPPPPAETIDERITTLQALLGLMDAKLVDIQAALEQLLAAVQIRTYMGSITGVAQPYVSSTDYRLTVRVPASGFPVPPTTGQAILIVKD